jgi:hypothetical protein
VVTSIDYLSVDFLRRYRQYCFGYVDQDLLDGFVSYGQGDGLVDLPELGRDL